MQQYPLLQTKLNIPPIRAELVSRPRLVEQLSAGLERKLTLISAPAGFGKTTLMSEWIAGRKWPVAWLSLDEGDGDLVRFLTYLVAALQTVDASIGEDVSSVLQSPQLPPPELLLTLLINDLAAVSLEDRHKGYPYVLVLDDYHVIQAPSVHESIAFLLDHLPPQLHLAILTREDPPLPLPRLRVQREITHIRAQDLRFTVGEVTEFLHQTMGLHLTAADVAALESRTEGWIAGLQLAALTMQNVGDPGAFIQAFSGDDRYVVDYLATEVLAQQPPHIQAFLLQTSVLQRFNASLCDAMRSGAGRPPDSSEGTDTRSGAGSPTEEPRGREILAQLDRANLFVTPLDHRREWYRYHHLFADLLRYQLRAQEGEAKVLALHRRAAQWYEQHGLIDDALWHYLAAQDTQAAAGLVEANAMLAFRRGDVHLAHEWLEALSEEVIRANLRLCFDSAWICVVHDDYPRLIELVTAAKSALPDGDGETDLALWGEWAALQAFAEYYLGETQAALELGQQALDQLPARLAFPRAVINILLVDIFTHTDTGQVSQAVACSQDAMAASLSSSNITTVLYAADRLVRSWVLQGQFRPTEAVFQQVFRLLRERDLTYAPVLEILYLRYARVLYELNRLDEAERVSRDGISLSQKFGARNGELWCRLLLRQAQTARGVARDAVDPLAADEALDALLLSLSDRQSRHPAILQLAALRAQLWTNESQLARADGWAQDSSLSLDDEPTHGQVPDYLALAHVCQALGTSLPQVLALLERLHQLALRKGHIEQLIEIKLLQALTLDKTDQSAAAQATLEQALALAEPTGMIRSFLDHGPPMIHLLRQAKHSYATSLVAASDSAAVDVPVPAPGYPQETLNEREIEVLQLFAAGLSNAAIARRLFVSQNTVKWYAKNIYSKLDVHSRAEALARAYETDLLP